MIRSLPRRAHPNVSDYIDGWTIPELAVLARRNVLALSALRAIAGGSTPHTEAEREQARGLLEEIGNGSR